VDERLAAELDLAALSHAEYVDRVYRLALRRAPEEAARERAVTALGDGTLSRATLLHELVTSPEFERVRALDDGVAAAAGARAADERPRNLSAPAGSDERLVEIPWVLSRYRGERRVLDVGSANGEAAYLAALRAAAPAPPTTVDLAGADLPGFETVVADVRKLPFARRSFDVALCISTLEHIGKDNRIYGLEAEKDPGGIPDALNELKRILTRRGRLLITVPTGENEDREWFVQRDPAAWRSLFLKAGFAIHELELYELADDGWRSTEALPRGLRYGARGPGASAVLCVELRPGRIRQALRRRAAALRRGGARGTAPAS
jgi:SAM-dependent methyltransferase